MCDSFSGCATLFPVSGGDEAVQVQRGDCHLGNWLSDGLHITAMLDWEEAGIGDPRLDVAVVESSLRHAAPELAESFLRDYEEKAGWALGPLQIWHDLMRVRDQAVGFWMKHRLAEKLPTPRTIPKNWVFDEAADPAPPEDDGNKAR